MESKNRIVQRSKFPWTIPNILSLYRLLVFPFVLYLVFAGKQSLFAIFITVSLVSDFLDGFIARTFNMQTEIGAKLDSWADTGTYILALLAVYFFKWEDFSQHLYPLIGFVIVLSASYVVVFVKFKSLIGLHTYLFKITGYLQGGFFVMLFLLGFFAWFYYVAIFVGILACIEEIIIILLIPQPRTNVKGLYWVIRNGNR
jgi:cardiolipin synthase